MGADVGEAYEFWLANSDDTAVRQLFNVARGGTLEWNVLREVPCQGSITREYPDDGLDWLDDRLIIRYRRRERNVEETYQLGVFIVSNVAPTRKGFRTVSEELTLMDKTTLLQQSQLGQSLGFPAGTVATTAAKQLLDGFGQSAITDSDKTLSTAISWSADTPYLTAVNDILESISYRLLWADASGLFRVEPFPDYGNLTYSFEPDQAEWLSPEVADDRDLYSIPNKKICIGTATDNADPLVGVAVNMDPTSPWSYQGRGNRWITSTDTEVAAATQADIDTIAANRLLDAAQVTWRQTVKHLYDPNAVPWAIVNNVDGLKCKIIDQKVTMTAGAWWETICRRFDTVLGDNEDDGSEGADGDGS